eukprot:1159668-Pelagomonas_calceolata.AAC.14
MHMHDPWPFLTTLFLLNAGTLLIVAASTRGCTCCVCVCLKVSQEDVEEHVRQKEAAKSKAAASKLGGFGGHGGPAAASTPPSNQKASDSGSKQAAAQAGKAGEAAGGGGGGGAPTGEEALAKMMAAVPLSELEKQLQAYQRRKVGNMWGEAVLRMNGSFHLQITVE